MIRWRVLCGLLLALAGWATAQDKTEPEAREAIPRGFRMYLVTDGRFDDDAKKKKDPKKEPDIRIRVGKLHDPVTEMGLSTVVGVFVKAIPKNEEDPALKLLKFEQELAEKFRTQRLGAFMAFLALSKDFAEDDARYALIAEIKKLADAAMVPLVQTGLAEATLADGTVPPQVKAWGINADDSITIVLYHRFKLIKRWSFKMDTPPTDKELQELSSQIDAIIGKKVE